MTAAVPPALRAAYDLWNDADRPKALPSPWARSRWKKYDVPVPADLPESEVDRDEVTKWTAKASSTNRDSQRDAFVVSMVWGHSRSGYGPSRTQTILSKPDFADQLAEVTRVTIEQGGVEGYKLVHQKRKTRRSGSPLFFHGLGAAFGTKYLYFLTRAHHPEAVTPVLDAVATRWFAEHAPEVKVDVGDDWGYPERYGAYVETLHTWGKELGIAADEVEHLLFAQQAGADGNLWGEDWIAQVPMGAGQLLSQLTEHLRSRGLEEESREVLTTLRTLLDPARGEIGGG